MCFFGVEKTVMEFEKLIKEGISAVKQEEREEIKRAFAERDIDKMIEFVKKCEKHDLNLTRKAALSSIIAEHYPTIVATVKNTNVGMDVICGVYLTMYCGLKSFIGDQTSLSETRNKEVYDQAKKMFGNNWEKAVTYAIDFTLPGTYASVINEPAFLQWAGAHLSPADRMKRIFGMGNDVARKALGL